MRDFQLPSPYRGRVQEEEDVSFTSFLCAKEKENSFWFFSKRISHGGCAKKNKMIGERGDAPFSIKKSQELPWDYEKLNS